MKASGLIKWLISMINIKNIKTLLRSKWVIFGVGPLVTLIGVALVIWIGHLLTTHPLVCLSCHAKQSSLPMWAPSQVHPSRVSCVHCHAQSGQLFPIHFYADDRVNDNCLGCHRQVVGSEMDEAHHMRIAHKLHIEESKLMCIDCHRNIAHEKMEVGTNRPRKLTCMECHEEAIQGGPEECMKCHTKIPAKSS